MRRGVISRAVIWIAQIRLSLSASDDLFETIAITGDQGEKG